MQALCIFEIFEQQPSTAAILKSLVQQAWRCETVRGEQLRTGEFTIEMTPGAITHHEFGKYLDTSPLSASHIALPRQYTQPLHDMQLVGSQRDDHRKRRGTTSRAQLCEPHALAAL